MQRIVLITGSKEGFQTALQLAKRKWTVILADKQNLNESKNAITYQTSNPNIHCHHLDLEDFASIRNFTRKCDRIDVLINNAGIFEDSRQATVDGLDPVIQVNVLGPFLLTVLLTDALKKSPNSRLIFVSSSGAFLHNVTPTSLISPYPNYIVNYYNSKLFCMIFTRMFAKKLHKWGVTSNCVHPGMTGSNFLFQKSSLGYWVLKMFAQDPATSAQGVVFLATSKALNGTTGEYFENFQVHEVPRIVKNWQFCQEVWQQACQLTKLNEQEMKIFD